jgi:hypothetical protein
MSAPQFLCDEDVPKYLVPALRAKEPAIDILCVGDPGAPPKGTKDPNLLLAAEAMKTILLTRDRKSMPRHLASHFAAGHHTWGVLLMRRRRPLSEYVADILMVWGATEADEWLDRTDVIPY